MIFHDDVQNDDRRRIELAVNDIESHGDSLHRRIARFLAQTDLIIFVGPVSIVRGSGSVQLNDQKAARTAVLKGNLELAEAAAFVRLNIARETIDTGGQRGIEGTLVHEGKHALDFAKMLSTFSMGDETPNFNPTAFQKEYSAHLTSAFYLMRRGAEFIKEGLSLGLLREKKGKITVSREGIRSRLENSYRLTPKSPGATLDTASNPRIGAPEKKWFGIL